MDSDERGLVTLVWDEGNHCYVCLCGEQFPWPSTTDDPGLMNALQTMFFEAVAVHVRNDHRDRWAGD